MEMFKSIINNWSLYQLLSLVGMFLFVLIFFVFATWIISGKRKEFIKLSLFSFLSATALTILSFVILNIAFNIEITYIFLLTTIVVLLVEVMSIGMILGFFTSQHMRKEVSPLLLKKEVLKDSIQLTIFIVLLIMAFILSLTGTPFVFILTTTILSIATIWVNFFLVTLIFKND